MTSWGISGDLGGHGEMELQPVELLQRLLRFDTSNPPGNEATCIDFAEALLRDAGLSPERVAKNPGRPNLVVRLPGRGVAPALLFCGHVDVVPAGPTEWSHAPFSGDIADGCVWGRGALDMKGGVAMMLSALLRASRAPVPPAGDVILALVADEEAGGGCGAKFLVEDCPSLFRGVRYAIGEFGGFPLYLFGRTFYMIQVAEKRPVVLDLTLRGPAGHGARPARGGAMHKLARVLERIETHRLPVHITPVTRQMVETMATALPFAGRAIARGLLHPTWTDRVLDRLGDSGRLFEPLFRNTVSATVVRGGERPNVIPSEIHLALDGRILPGYSVEDLLGELRPLLCGDAEVQALPLGEPTAEPDLALFDLLGQLLRRRVPTALPVPYLLPGSTDGRHLSRLGIQTYGFTPMSLPPDLSFFSTIHAADERIPVDAVQFGADVLYDLIEAYGPREARLA